MVPPSQHTDQPLWWQDGVIYQIYPRSFADSNGDGVGDLIGITRKLDYLTWLGVTSIWISPFYPSPMADFGYDVSDYVDIDPQFGTLADFDQLIKEAHQRNLRVIVDWVPNHSSDQHPWFQEAHSSKDSSKRDWYCWADAKPDGTPPNNWLSNFGGPAWTFDQHTQQYYRHSFLPEQPDLNWRNPELQAAMFDTLRFWLDRGVDGFRIDSAHNILKDPSMRDNPPNPESEFTMHKSYGEYDSQLHMHDKAHEDVHTVYRELRTLLDRYSLEHPRVATGEMHIKDWPQWASYYGTELDELHMPLNFGFLFAHWSAEGIRQVVEELEAILPPGAWPNYVLGNHDEARILSRIGAGQARMAMLLLLTLRGTPTIYYGDEIGMKDSEIPLEMIQDPWEKRVPGLGLGRDPERTPMQWNGQPEAGFTTPGTTPWLPLAPDFQEVNVEKQAPEVDSFLTLTRTILQQRQSTPALLQGAYATLAIPEATSTCFTFTRTLGNTRLLIALNFTGKDQHITIPGNESGTVLISTHLDRNGQESLAGFHLRPDEGCLIELAN
ncbi:MAG TPA: alpha-amylase family glycosyl hydrolase [Ktedonobacteraceae bacterium]|nr:alpha-amylase family glycosyl hydrolase [Ktedonobacteraceae bacterium]